MSHTYDFPEPDDRDPDDPDPDDPSLYWLTDDDHPSLSAAERNPSLCRRTHR